MTAFESRGQCPHMAVLSHAPHTPERVTEVGGARGVQVLAKKEFADLVDEVVQQFTIRPGVKVKIAVEIQAESVSGLDDGLQRAVKENCNVLKCKNAEFETGE